MVTCQHAASGCDYPAGECSGACVTNNTQRQPAAPQYLTIVYQIHSPGQVQALLHATDWTAMSHSHAILDRDTAIKLRDALHAELNDVQDQRREAFRAIERLNDEIGRLTEQRDLVLSELKLIVQWDDCGLALTESMIGNARKAIAKVEGGAT